jgi:hypothetical protein
VQYPGASTLECDSFIINSFNVHHPVVRDVYMRKIKQPQITTSFTIILCILVLRIHKIHKITLHVSAIP